MSRFNWWARPAHRASIAGLLFCFVCLLSPQHVSAQVGSILVSSGDNQITHRTGEQTPVQAGVDLSNGDTIRTGQRGHIQLRFVDGAIVSLRPRSVFRIDEYRVESERPRSFLSLLRGALRTATGSISKRSPSAYRLTTPSATIGVRGTHFVARETVCEGPCPAGEKPGLHVSVSEGGITVTNDQGSVELDAGQSAWVPGADQTPVKTALAPVLSPRAYQPDRPPILETPWRGPVKLARGKNKTANSTPVFQEPAASSSESQSEEEGNPRDLAKSEEPAQSEGPLQSEAPDRHWPDDGFGSVPEDFSGPGRLAGPSDPVGTPRTEDGGYDRVGWVSPPTLTGTETPDDDGDQSGSDSPGTDPAPNPPIADITPAPAPGTLAADRWRIELRAVPGLSSTGLVAGKNATVQLDSATRLESIGACPSLFCLARGNAQVAEAGSDDFAAWGRWTDGSIETSILGIRSQTALTDREGLHYLVGVPAVSLPAQGTFGYSLVGATAPTTVGLGWAPGRFSGSAAVQFAPGTAPRIGMEGQIDIGYDQFTFATNGGVANPGASQLSANDQASFNGTLDGQAGTSAPWFCGNQPCNVKVGGALIGPSGERLGVGYSVISESGSTTIDGAAVFGRD